MARYKNQQIWSTDHAFLQNLADEQRDYIGRDFMLDLQKGVLIIYALPRRYKKKDAIAAKSKKRDKREEKFERRARD